VNIYQPKLRSEKFDDNNNNNNNNNNTFYMNAEVPNKINYTLIHKDFISFTILKTINLQ